jgi:hypothetical protein
MSDDTHSRPEPIPHVRLYVGAGVLFALAAGALVFAILEPHVPGIPAIGAATAIIGAGLVIGTASMKRYERYDTDRRAEAAQVLKAIQDHEASRHAEADELDGAMGTLAYDMRRIIAFVERGVGMAHDLSERLEGMEKRIDALAVQQEALAKALEKTALGYSAGYVDGLIEQESGQSNVRVIKPSS